MKLKFRTYVAVSMLALACAPLIVAPLSAHAQAQRSGGAAESAVTHYRTAKVDGIDIFYRESGPTDAPVVVLLHGSPRRRTCSATSFLHLPITTMSSRRTILASVRAARRIERDSNTASPGSPN